MSKPESETADDLPIEKCPRCGLSGVAFNCFKEGCPMSTNDRQPKTAISSAEIKDAILYKLVSIALQVANDPRDADELGKLVNALEEAIDNGR